MAEEFNQKPYAVNVFPVGNESADYKGVELKGNPTLVNMHKNGEGEIIARLYNPSLSEEEFSLKIGDVSICDRLTGAEVATIVVKDGVAKLIRDKMPV